VPPAGAAPGPPGRPHRSSHLDGVGPVDGRHLPPQVPFGR
jgi:hypothetical protein